MESEGITHRTLAVNGIDMHVAEKGAGPVVLLIHGFPELWYSWRRQILALAARGYHAVAPDLRGYGGTTAPASASSYTVFHVVGDLVGLIDALGPEQVFVVGHDWGAIVAWHLCLFRPDKVKALVNLSVPYTPRNPAEKPLDLMRRRYGDDYYIVRFQEPGAMEDLFARYGTENVIKKFWMYHSSSPLFIKKEFEDPPSNEVLPSWLSEEDVKYYARFFAKSGFTGGFNYYRCLNLNWELSAPWTGVQIKVPTKFIIGDMDLTYNYTGVQNYIHNGGFQKCVPFLQEVVVLKGVGHFLHQERASEVNDHIFEFIQKF